MKKTSLLLISIILLSFIFLFNWWQPNNFYNASNELISSSDKWSAKHLNQSISENTYKGTCSFNGYGTIWSYNCDEDKVITAPYSLNVKSGQAKLILITEDNEVSTIVENTANAEITEGKLNIHVKKGDNRIKFVGSDADAELELTIEEGTLKTIDF